MALVPTFGVGKSWLVALAAAAAVLPIMPAGSESRDRSWLGVERIAILSRLTQGRILNEGISAQSICERLKPIVAEGAPGAVECILSIGDPAVGTPGTGLLILDAALAEVSGAGQQLLFTVRRDRTHGLEPRPVYFGTAPRAVPADAFIREDRAVDEALRASLSEILPWLRPGGTGELSPIKWERN